METDLASLFLLGVTGTVHCAAMCGPLVVALAGRSRGLGAAAYHAGRIATYTAVGALMGLAGQATGGGPAAGTMRLQVVLSLVSAALLLVFGLSRLGLVPEPRFLANPTGAFGRAVAALRAGGPGRLLAMGLLLGLLPCGLSWAAFSRALAAPTAVEGGLMTLAFGLGTLPGLVAVGTGGAAILRRHARLADLLSGVVLIAMAALLVARAVPALGT